MDIRGWPLDRIMQLPDCCFGRRWPVYLEVYRANEGSAWDISEVAIPDRAVLWFFGWSAFLQDWDGDYIRLAWGDKLPATVAEFNSLEPVIPGMGRQGAEPRVISGTNGNEEFYFPMRLPVFPQGRRPILELTLAGAFIDIARAVLIFSSIPTEVPDWLISGRV